MTIANVKIRERQSHEFETTIEIGNAIMPPDSRVTLDEARLYEGWQDSTGMSLRLLAWVDDRAVATGFAGSGMFMAPNRFAVSVRVLPEYRRRGIAGALYEKLVTFALDKGAKELTANVHEHHLPLVEGWLASESYREIERRRPSEVTIENMDLDAWAYADERPSTAGITFTTLAEADTEENRRKLWELGNVTARDVPHDRPVDLTYERFVEMIERPEYMSDCVVIARDGDRYVGFTNLIHQTPDRALTGMTGVLREYRNKGIALALKIRSFRIAREHGYKLLRTSNHVNNPAMLAVNARLGYRPLPEGISFLKTLES